MTVAERLAGVPFGDFLRERGTDKARTVLRCSESAVYRKVANSTLAHLKVDGARRRVGRRSFLLEDLARYQVEREVLPGAAQKTKLLPAIEVAQQLADEDQAATLVFDPATTGDAPPGCVVSASAVCETWSIKGDRRTAVEMEHLEEGLVRIVEEEQPTTVRHVFYKAVAAGLIPKTEEAYKGTIVRLLTRLRRAGSIPYRSISDNTRWTLGVRSYGSASEGVASFAQNYRRNLWAEADARVEIWCEKDAVAGILSDTASAWCVPVMVFRGYSSVSYLYTLAEDIRAHGLPTFVYYFGDHDPSGVDVERFVTKTVREMVPEAAIYVQRQAVTPEQIEALGLPTRPTKKTDSRAKAFVGESVEVDALDSGTLQFLAERAIRQHLDKAEVERLMLVEKQERKTLAAFAARLKRKAS